MHEEDHFSTEWAKSKIIYSWQKILIKTMNSVALKTDHDLWKKWSIAL